MKLHYFSKYPNFGDTINPWFWRHYINCHFDNNSDEIFVGIGTLINDELPINCKAIHIMGTGAGYGEKIPRQQKNWIVHCVRGPLTARAIGVSPSHAITDPAVLISELVPTITDRDCRCAFMPHVELDSPRLQKLVESCDIRYISPKDDPESVISSVNRSGRLITSAMHGAILADALRVPWYPVSNSPNILTFKWLDWFQSMNIKANLHRIPTIWPDRQPGVKGTLIVYTKEALFKRELIRIQSRGSFQLSSKFLLKEKCEKLKKIFSDFNNLRSL